jgi:hypothetical protein
MYFLSGQGEIMFLRSRKFHYLIMGLLMSSVLAAVAAPALWYRWRSKLEASYVCSQTVPGEGWVQFSGPFMDGRCEKLKPR